MFIEIGDGIGAGIILDNHLGFVIRNKGFLEKNASIKSIKESAVDALAKGEWRGVSETAVDGLTPSSVCEAAYSGEEVPKGILDRIVRYLAVEIIKLTLTLNPQIVVIGEDAGIVGATFFAINSFLLNEFPNTVSRKMAIVG